MDILDTAESSDDDLQRVVLWNGHNNAPSHNSQDISTFIEYIVVRYR